jgi:misacylated tRNA(Ala) deacylase
MTELLFIETPDLSATSATVTVSQPEAIELDKTVFYGRGGGQPGDTGQLLWPGGRLTVVDTRKGEAGRILHIPETGSALPSVGTVVDAVLDWPRRQRLMRMHTALHLLCSLLPGAGVTGGQIGADRSRLDFDLPNPPPRETLQAGLDHLIAADHPISAEWVDESVLDTQPELVRTLSVQPPRGTGRLRLVRIGAVGSPIDLQPCGGTHVAHTGEIGALLVAKIENKGKQNRRITLTWPEGAS